MRERRIAALVLCSALFACLPALGAEGRTPVFLPGTVLGADGKYILTRNLVAAAGPVISICGGDVDLDLNGFQVSNGGGGSVITMSAACGADHVTIKNGSVAGGGIGIEVLNVRKVDLEDLKIHDGSADGIQLFNVLNAAVRRVQVVDGGGVGINWVGPLGPKVGTIENNIVRRRSGGIHVRNSGSSVAILTNRIEEIVPGGALLGDAIVLEDCEGTLVSENTIEDPNRRGIDVINQSHGNKLFDNVVFGAGSIGIRIDATSFDNLILNNVVSSSGVGGGFGPADALLIEGGLNLIERNLLNTSTGFGLRFCGPAACGNVFGRNMARNNGGGFNPVCAPAACNAAAGTMGPVLFPPNSCNQPIGCPAIPGGANSTYGDNLIPGPPIF